MEPIEESEEDEEDEEEDEPNEFVNSTVGMNIPHQFIPAIQKSFYEQCEKGVLVGSKCIGVRFVLEDGMAHSVDSSELSFRMCTQYAFMEAFEKCQPQILEPVMQVIVNVPTEFQVHLILTKKLINVTRVMFWDS